MHMTIRDWHRRRMADAAGLVLCHGSRIIWFCRRVGSLEPSCCLDWPPCLFKRFGRGDGSDLAIVRSPNFSTAGRLTSAVLT